MDKKWLAILILVAIIIIGVVGFFMISNSYIEIHEGDIKDDGHFTFTITDIDDKGLGGVDINIVEYYNNKVIKNYTATSDDNGLITGTLSNQKEGNHTVVVNYYENGELDSTMNITNDISYERL